MHDNTDRVDIREVKIWIIYDEILYCLFAFLE